MFLPGWQLWPILPALIWNQRSEKSMAPVAPVADSLCADAILHAFGEFIAPELLRL